MRQVLHNLKCNGCGMPWINEAGNGWSKPYQNCPYRIATPTRSSREAAKPKLICGEKCAGEKSEITEIGKLAHCANCPNQVLVEEAAAKTGGAIKTVHKSERGSAEFWKRKFLTLQNKIRTDGESSNG